MLGARAICRRVEPLSLPSCALSATSQRIITPAIDTIVVAAGNRLAVAKIQVEGVGKDIVPTETTRSHVRFISTPHATDIESLDLHPSGTLLATADSSGRACLQRIRNWNEDAEYIPDAALQLAAAAPSSYGWCGARFAGDKLVTAHFGGRYFAVYDDTRLITVIPTMARPTAMCFSDEGLLLLGEGNSLSAWDLRSSQSPVKRLRVRNPDCGGLTLAAGADRSVHIFDTRKWAARGHWSSCLKYSVTSLHFAQSSDACYVGGLDSELLCGQWSGKSSSGHNDGFRADSRWLGIAKGSHGGNDYIAGCTERGSLYIIVNSFALFAAPKGRTPAAAEVVNIE